MAKTNINHRAPIPRPISGPNKQKKKPELCSHQGHKCRFSFNRASWFRTGPSLTHTCSWRNHRSLVNKQWPRRPSGQAQRCPSHLRFVKEKLHEVFAEQLPGVREVQHSGAYTNCSILGPLAKCSWQMSWPTPSPLSQAFITLHSKVRCNFDLLLLANCSFGPAFVGTHLGQVLLKSQPRWSDTTWVAWVWVRTRIPSKDYCRRSTEL